MKQKLHQILGAFFILSVISCQACFRSELLPTPILAGSAKLEKLATNEIFVCFEDEDPSSKVIGRQFVFMLFPVGTVYASQLDLSLRNRIRELLGRRNLRPIFECGEIRFPRLILRVEQVSCDAFDYIFRRHLVATVDIVGQYNRSSLGYMRNYTAQAEEDQWSATGFAPDLEYVFESALEQALDEVFNNLDL